MVICGRLQAAVAVLLQKLRKAPVLKAPTAAAHRNLLLLLLLLPYRSAKEACSVTDIAC